MIDTMKNEKHDHFNTPAYAVTPLLKYIDPRWAIWKPTDTYGRSQITETLKKHGNKVIATSKDTFNFLQDDPKFDFNCIITNPPYSLKDEFIARCIHYTARGKKWAMLMPLTVLEGIKRRKMLNSLGETFGVLVLDRRVEFTGGSCWFNTSWFCCGVLPKQIIFSELRKDIDTINEPDLWQGLTQ